MLISIQYARALAAWLVVWAHISGFAMFSPLGRAEFGGIGVDVFFVISGFIMWETTGSQTPGTFAIRRIARVVPAYWFYTALIIALHFAAPQLTPRVQTDLPQVISSFLFIPHANQRGELNPILLQGWTLNYEMYFYLVFGLSLFLKHRTNRFLAVGVFFAGAALLGVLLQPRGNLFEVYTSSIVLEFVLGMGLSIAVRSTPPSKPVCVALCALGAVFTLLGGIYASSAALRVASCGVPAAIFLYGLIGLEEVLRRHQVGSLVMLGNTSYSLYLAHPFALSAAAVVMKVIATRLALDPLTTAAGFACIAVIVCAGLSLLSYRLIELPMSRVITSLFVRRALTGRGEVAEQAVR